MPFSHGRQEPCYRQSGHLCPPGGDKSLLYVDIDRWASTSSTPQPLHADSEAAVMPSHWSQKMTRPWLEAISQTAEK